jgi:hypothetical protein
LDATRLDATRFHKKLMGELQDEKQQLYLEAVSSSSVS